MSNINTKLSDDVLAFVQSPVWSLVKFRVLDFSGRLQTLLSTNIRQKEWNTVAMLQGKIDAINEVIRITENLPKEIRMGELDVDAALSVIENKTGR